MMFLCFVVLISERWHKQSDAPTLKNIRTSLDILWRVFRISSELVLYTFISVNQRRSLGLPGLRYSADLQITNVYRTADILIFLVQDVMYTSRAYATMSVSICMSVRLSVTVVHCGRGACREEGRGHLALC